MSLESDVLKRIKPSKEEVDKINDIADRLKKMAGKYLEAHNIKANLTFVGSFSKGTFLSNPDLDLFLMFPKNRMKKSIEEICLKMGEELIHGKKAYAEHPYSSGEFEGLEVDMVPCYEIDDPCNLMTPVDRSPFHTKYILSKVDEKMEDEIRLTKKFMKGIGTYGAEPNVRGFSGYLCELLTIHYGGFLKLVDAASKWSDHEVIIMEKEGPNFNAPLVLYDPVDYKRNVASAVHLDTMREFKLACSEYKKHPDIKFFFPNERKPLSKKELENTLKKHGTKLLTVYFDRPDINIDNLHAQNWRTREAIEKKLKEFDFNVVSIIHSLSDKKIVQVYELETDELSLTTKHEGPPSSNDNSVFFLEKWKDNPYGRPFEENGRWYVIAERTYRSPIPMLEHELSHAGIGKDVDPKTVEMLNSDDTIKKTDSLLLTELLVPMHRWEI